MKPGPETSATRTARQVGACATTSAAMSRGGRPEPAGQRQGRAGLEVGLLRPPHGRIDGGAGHGFERGGEPVGRAELRDSSDRPIDGTASAGLVAGCLVSRALTGGATRRRRTCVSADGRGLPASVAADGCRTWGSPLYRRRRGKMDGVKKLINAAGDVVGEALDGLTLTNAGIARLAGSTTALRSDIEEVRAAGHVALLSGGGAGHEPAHAGYVGAGMLTGGGRRRGVHVAVASTRCWTRSARSPAPAGCC